VKVFLLTFNPITNLPQGVTHVDAARYMTFKLFRQLLGVRQNLKGRRHIAVIADVIRVLWLIDNGAGSPMAIWHAMTSFRWKLRRDTSLHR